MSNANRALYRLAVAGAYNDQLGTALAMACQKIAGDGSCPTVMRVGKSCEECEETQVDRAVCWALYYLARVAEEDR